MRVETPDLPLSYRVEKITLTKRKTAVIVNDSLRPKGIPPEVFEYRLGNRSALEWVLDQTRSAPTHGAASRAIPTVRTTNSTSSASSAKSSRSVSRRSGSSNRSRRIMVCSWTEGASQAEPGCPQPGLVRVTRHLIRMTGVGTRPKGKARVGTRRFGRRPVRVKRVRRTGLSSARPGPRDETPDQDDRRGDTPEGEGPRGNTPVRQAAGPGEASSPNRAVLSPAWSA